MIRLELSVNFQIALALLGFTCFCATGLAAEVDHDAVAARILADAGVRGGLVVHLGCGDGKLTAALRANESYVVHGLDTDSEDIAKARKNIRELDLYGPVSVEHWDAARLPYADNLVNLLVAENLGQTPMAEVIRVLAPGGVALVGKDGKWTKTAKPRPDEIDEWTHYLHDSTNNAVAKDKRVATPKRMQWKVGPLWSRSHEHPSSIAAMVSDSERIFYVVDEGLTSITHITEPRIPERWTLIARDAFSGVLLWKKPLPNWRGDEWKGSALRNRPASVPRRIVTDGKRLYATLNHEAGVSVIDPAGGDVLSTIPKTAGAQEIIKRGDSLFVYAGKPTGRGGTVTAIDAENNRPRWTIETKRYAPQSLVADDERVVICDADEMVCLSTDDGAQLWRVAAAGSRGLKTIVLTEKIVLEAGGSKIIARATADGKTRWTAPGGQGSMRPNDIFVAQGCVWHAAGKQVAGYDIETGEVVKTLDPSAVQSDGHHLRCYRAKATESFLITQFRGAEFVDLGDENHANNDWVRGACTFGLMPANGLLYVPPNPCFCYPGAKLTGMLALSGEVQAKPTGEPTAQFESGPAYGQKLAAESSSTSDWPTYRHDSQRSGAAGCDVSADVSQQWQVSLNCPITPPVVASGKVFTAAKNEHTLYAFNSADGSPAWQFTAGGRIDSPPTIYRGLVLFGSADGRVYCLRASDGELVWRYRPVADERRIMAFDQLESAWRVHGNVTVDDGVAYCTAGRSSFLDGGLTIVGLDPETGEVKCETRLDTNAPVRKDFQGKPFIPSYHIEGSHSDILVAEGGHIYLTQYKFDRNLKQQPAPYPMRDPDHPVASMDLSKEPYTIVDSDMKNGFEHFRGFHRWMEQAHGKLSAEYRQKYGGMSMGDRKTGRHLVATGGFLDDNWFNRTYWMYSDVWPGWYHAHRGAKSGQLLVVGPKRTYALQAYPYRNMQSPLFTPESKGYLLVADSNDTEPVLDDQTRGATKGLGYSRLKPPVWFDWAPVRIRAMVLAGDCLFAAGPPDVIDADDPMASFEGRKGAVLRTYSAADGKLLAERKLDFVPAFDGLIAADGSLFISATDGRLICLGASGIK